MEQTIIGILLTLAAAMGMFLAYQLNPRTEGIGYIGKKSDYPFIALSALVVSVILTTTGLTLLARNTYAGGFYMIAAAIIITRAAYLLRRASGSKRNMLMVKGAIYACAGGAVGIAGVITILYYTVLRA